MSSPSSAARPRQRLALAAFVLTVAMLVVALPFGIGLEPVSGLIGFRLLAVALATAGLLVARRQPDNPVGWLLLAIAGLTSAEELCQTYGLRAVRDGLPAGEVAEWVTTWIWILDIAALALVFLLFPDGRPPSPRWRPVGGAVIAGCAFAVPGIAIGTSNGEEFSAGRNPFAVAAAPGDAMATIGLAILVAALLVSAGSLLARFRRARGVEREQLKWLMVAASVFGIALLTSLPFWSTRPLLAEAMIAATLPLIPIAVCIAMLRYRLYDVDVVVNRTLVYGLLTAALALAYLGSVILLQLALSPLGESDLAVAGSTLAVAALFRPVRARVQTLVDRRFFRRRYDAARTLEVFGAKLRDAVDLGALDADLRAAVDETMRPAHVSLWLRPPEGTGGG